MINAEKDFITETSSDLSISNLTEHRFIAAILIIIVSLSILDICLDLAQGVDGSHIIMEAIIIPLAGYGLYLVWNRLVRAHKKNIVLKSNLQTISEVAQKWKEEAGKYITGLSEAIDSQLNRWNLSTAEKQIAMLLLKGLSLKEIAEIRATSERTVRQQALSIYEKSGMTGRAQLSAFFLEDLLILPKE